MNKRIAIQGHPTRGGEVLDILEDKGGKREYTMSGHYPDMFYYIREDGRIDCDNEEDLPKNYTRVTLEGYLATLPQVEIADRLTIPQGYDKMEVRIPDDCELINEDGKWVLRRKHNMLWMARNKDGLLFLHVTEPTLDEEQGVWYSKDRPSLCNNIFPEVTFENSPKRIKLTLMEE